MLGNIASADRKVPSSTIYFSYLSVGADSCSSRIYLEKNVN